MLKTLEKHSPFGVLATDAQLPEGDWKLPEYDQSGAAATLNTMGSMLINSDPIVDAFVDLAGLSRLPLLDVGAGYGVATIPALAVGARVVANDIDERHLLVLRKQTCFGDRERLYLKCASFPHELDFPADSFDGIMLRRIIHFLTAEKMPIVFSKVAKWLRPGGYLFIVCMSPYHKYIPGFIDIYEQRWESGIAWPGIIPNLRDYTSDLLPEIPNFIHVMDERPLARAIEPYFTLKMSQLFDYQALPRLESHRGFYGLIAERN